MRSRTSRTRYAAQRTTTASAIMEMVQRIVAFGTGAGSATERLPRPIGEELAREITDEIVDVGQFGWRGEEHDPEEAVLRTRPEAGPVHAQDTRGAQQREDVLLVRDAGRQRDLRHRVERRRRGHGRDSVDGVEPSGRELGA